MNLLTGSVICAVVGLVIYLNAINLGFCYDDLGAIENNKDLRPETSWVQLLWDDFWGTPIDEPGSHKSYRPLTVATFRLNYLMHELEPMGYHLVNTVLHSAVCYLYVQLCGVLFSEVWPAFIAGLLFAVHPIHTEAVAGIVGRADLLCCLFFIGTLLSYRKAAFCNQVIPAEFAFLFLSVLLCLCSALSKELGITVVAVCVCYDWFIIQKMNLSSSLQVLKLLRHPFVLPSWFVRYYMRLLLLGIFTTGFMALRLISMKGMPSFAVTENIGMTLESPYRQLHWLYLCFVNAWLLLNPSTLCVDWRQGAMPSIPSLLNNCTTILTVTVIGGLVLYGAIGKETSSKVILMGMALTILPFLPASNLFFPVGFVVAERILYIPSMGFCLLVGNGIYYLHKGVPKSIRILVKLTIVFLLVVHGTKTLIRNGDWYSKLTLYTAAIKTFPEHGMMYSNLGMEYRALENYSYAEELFRKAAMYSPHTAQPLVNLGSLLALQNETVKAEEALRKAIEVAPLVNTLSTSSMAEVYQLLIKIVSADENRLQEALKLCQSALAVKPDSPQILSKTGEILLKLQRPSAAAKVLEKAIQYKPDYTSAHFHLGETYLKLGEKALAENSFRTVILQSQDHILAKFHLGVLISESADVSKLREAESLLHDVLAVEPDNGNATFSLALVYYSLHNFQKTEELFQRALTLSPMHKGTLYNLGFLYSTTERCEQALRYLLELKELDPSHLNGLFTLGNCYYKLKKLREAEEAYNSVVKQNPGHVSALFNLGILELQLGELEVARTLLSKVLELDPDNEPAKQQLASIK